LSDAAVLVVVIFEDGKEFHTVGWIVDRERRIVMTNKHLVSNATKIIVAYPQLGNENNKVTGAPAVRMKYKTDRDIAYLQVGSPIPESIATLVRFGSSQPGPSGKQEDSEQLGGPRKQPKVSKKNKNADPLDDWNEDTEQTPAKPKNPLIGQWSLQHTGNGIRLRMKASFSENNQFRVDMISIDAEGNQENESLFGTYTIEGNTIYMQTNEGPQQATFQFKDGYLCIKLPGSDVTFMFQR
jgi:hypothetical protein